MTDKIDIQVMKTHCKCGRTVIVSSENSTISGPGFINNTLALVFVLGWQGGTVHQVANVLGVSTGDILQADERSMGELLRLAQRQRTAPIAPCLEATLYDICERTPEGHAFKLEGDPYLGWTFEIFNSQKTATFSGGTPIEAVQECYDKIIEREGKKNAAT